MMFNDAKNIDFRSEACSNFMLMALSNTDIISEIIKTDDSREIDK